jgi:hypothetical protein
MQDGLGTIFSNMVNDNPTVKNKVCERVFHYIISGLGSICHFTNSYKQMCGCRECVGLHPALFAAGKTWCHALPVCNRCATLHQGSASHREDKGVGRFCMAPKAIAGHR